jgi:SpoIID/LytB domain protein
MEFLKTHAIISRSWLISALNRKRKILKEFRISNLEFRISAEGRLPEEITPLRGQTLSGVQNVQALNSSQSEREGEAGAPASAGRDLLVEGATPLRGQTLSGVQNVQALNSSQSEREGEAPTALLVEGATLAPKEIVLWYEQEDHDLYDVCADDHCQRYQGITKTVLPYAGEAVLETRGQLIIYEGEICDARYSKACGGITEAFETAWSDVRVPYLISIPDSEIPCQPIMAEEDACRWILSEPDAYCNTKDADILEKILPDFDRETESFFRWKIKYTREELEAILMEKSGFDFGTLMEIQPLSRGQSGRIFRLKIVGSKKSMIVGKELEIRRWLAKSHLYSSAFVVMTECGVDGEIKSFVFHGAGWGHGVGFCQIGAAVMATKGFSAGEILSHYFPGTEIKRLY